MEVGSTTTWHFRKRMSKQSHLQVVLPILDRGTGKLGPVVHFEVAWSKNSTLDMSECPLEPPTAYINLSSKVVTSKRPLLFSMEGHFSHALVATSQASTLLRHSPLSYPPQTTNFPKSWRICQYRTKYDQMKPVMQIYLETQQLQLRIQHTSSDSLACKPLCQQRGALTHWNNFLLRKKNHDSNKVNDKSA